MAKRRAGNQTVRLTPNQKKSRIDPISLSAEGMRHTVEKLWTRATTFFQAASRSKVCSQSYGAPKSRESLLARFQVPGEKSHLDVGSVASHIVYYKGEGGGFPQVRAVVSPVCPCCPWLVLAPKVFQLCTNHLVWVVCRPVWVSEACQLFLVLSWSSNTPYYPSKCCELRSVPWFFFFSVVFHLGPHLGPLRSWECIKNACKIDKRNWSEGFKAGKVLAKIDVEKLRTICLCEMFFCFYFDLVGWFCDLHRGCVQIVFIAQIWSFVRL
jgi:hypothetical protein